MAGMSEKRPEVSICDLVDTKQAYVPGRRRHWPAALKRQIVAETLVPGASASVVARQHDVNANQLFRWRRDWRDGLLSTADAGHGLVPVRSPAGKLLRLATPGLSRSILRMVCVSGEWRGGWGCASSGARSSVAAMIGLPSGTRVWLATGATDMRQV